MTDYLAQLRDGVPFEEVLTTLASDLPFKVTPDTRPRTKTILDIYIRAEENATRPFGPFDTAQIDFEVAMDEDIITEEQLDTAIDLMNKLDVKEPND